MIYEPEFNLGIFSVTLPMSEWLAIRPFTPFRRISYITAENSADS